MQSRLLTYPLPAHTNHRIYVATDIHFEAVRPRRLAPILHQAKKSHPDSIILAGDTINYLDDLQPAPARTYFREFLQNLSKVAPVYIGLGNHDQMYFNREYTLATAQKEQQIYLNFLKSVPEVTVLHNRKVKLSNNLYLTGLTLPRSCYQSPGSKSTWESPAELSKVLKGHHALLRRPAKSSTHLLLVHSPRRLTPEVLAALPGVDYIIAGHMHQGCIPLGLDEILPGTLGLVAPGYAPSPRRARHTYPRYSDKLLVLPAYTTFTGHRFFLNALFPQSHTLLTLQKP